MIRSIRQAAAMMVTASALSLTALSANATGGHHTPPPKPDCGLPSGCNGYTLLKFSTLLSTGTMITRENTVGGTVKITATGGVPVIVAGELGVATKKNWDVRIGSGETITFTFDDQVELAGWDLDDLAFGTNKFTLALDGGLATQFSLKTSSPGTSLIGKVFTFGYKGDSYFIDSLRFNEVCPPAVPEASTYGMALAGLFTLGAFARRRRQA